MKALTLPRMYDDFSVEDKFNICKNCFQKKSPLAFVRPYLVINFSSMYMKQLRLKCWVYVLTSVYDP